MSTPLIIQVRGDIACDSENCLADAIADLRAGAPRLRSRYFGVKDYDRFRGQRYDCEYWMGPRHGHIVFAVELTQEARKRTEPFTQGELSDAIGYLNHLKRGKR